jgi:catechol 2,3-dioxygenase-like lactoylglutathione lyase family enzyme
MRLDQVMIFVKDLDRMTAFYRDIVGFRPNGATRLKDWVEFETGGAGFALHAIPPRTSESIDIASPPAPREDQPCKLIVAVDDVDAELARLEGQGVPILRRPWGGWDFVDPEGNVLGVRSAGI